MIMQLGDNCKILKIYISEDSRFEGHNLYHALVIKLRKIGMAGVTVTRGLESYGKSRVIHDMKILSLSSSLPIIIEVIDEVEMIEKALPIVQEMVKEGLVITTDIHVIKYGRD
jgi:PII-like signaling protein